MHRIMGVMKGTVSALVLLLVPGPDVSTAAPLSLQEAVTLALVRSPVVSSAEQSLEAAKARERQSLGALLPRIDFEEAYMRTDQPVASFGSLLNQRRFTAADFAIDRLNDPDSLDNFRTKFKITQPLFTGGRIHQRRKMSEEERKASEWDLENTKARIGYRTVEAYWGLSLARESEKVAEMALKTAEESLRQISVLYEEGTVVQSDLLSAEVRKADFQDQLVRARGREKVAAKAMRLLIGESEDGRWDVSTLCPPAPDQIPPLDPEALLATAKRKRPEYVGLQRRLRAARAAVKAAQGNFLPTFGLEASYEWNSSNFASEQEGSYLLGLGVRWNLFNGLEDRAKLEEARSLWQRVRYEIKALEDTISLEIEEAVVAVRTGLESLRVTRERVGQAEENLRIVRQRYGEGLTTVVELEQAELILSRSRFQWLKAVHDVRLAMARLKLVTGELVSGVATLSCGPFPPKAP